MAAIRTPSKQQVATLAQSEDRFAVMAAITPRVPLGTRRCCDVRQIGPARQKALKFAVEDWDRVTASRESSSTKKLSRCKGIFFSAFAKKQSIRQCDLVASVDGFCPSCKALRKASKKNIVLPKAEYDVVTMAVYSRPGIKECFELWEEEANKISKDFKCPVQYPFFSAREILDMILIEGMVIFEEGGRGGTSYPRSACIIEAQNDHVKACLKLMLGILIFEKRQQFRKRWKSIVKASRSIHEYLQYLRTEEDGVCNFGVLQASDIIREELARASQVCKLKKCPARHISLPVQRLVDWVVNERMTKHYHSSSSPESVQTPASTSLQTPSTACKGVTPQLSMQKVSDVQSSQEQPNDTHKNEKLTQNQTHRHSFQEMMKKFSVPAKKATIIRQSTIEGAGEGLFITESAKDHEMVGRYSGKVLSAEEAAKSKSKYLLQINKNLFLDAEQEGHLEGRKLNCARKAGRKANVRFRSTLTVNYCKVTGVAWIPFYAIGDISPKGGIPEELLADYGELYWDAIDGQAMIILSQQEASGIDEDGEVQGADADEDHDSDEDFVPPTSSVATLPLSQSRPMTRSRREQMDSERNDLVWTNAHGEKLKQHPASSRKSDPATELQFSSPSNSDSSKSKQNSQVAGNNIHAVAVGRCIGLFLSVERMQQSLWHYPKGKFKICESIAQAEAYLATFSIHDPRKYWTEVFEEGTLSRNPRALINFRVCFPVGMLHEFYQPPLGFGTIVGTSNRDGTCCWSVRMDTGFVDHHVQEWPLLCAMEKARAVIGPAATAPVIRFHAIRGVPRPAVFESAAEVPQHVRQDHSRYRVFESRIEAQRWIEQQRSTIFFAVRGSDTDGVDSDMSLAALRMNEHSEMKSFTSREDALAWVDQSDGEYFALRGTEMDGVFTQREDVVARFKGKYAEFQRFSMKEQALKWIEDGKCFIRCKPGEDPIVVRKEALSMAKSKSPTAQFRGPFSAPSAHAMQEMLLASSLSKQSQKHASGVQAPDNESDDKHMHCIAQMEDGSKCGRTVNIQQTSIGMLCGWHASSIQKTSRPSENQIPADSPSSKSKQAEVESSPVEGIRLPPSAETLRKEKANKFAVFALRTFPDSKAPCKAAGSIWLSSADVEAANVHGGRMKMFNDDDDEHQDIFENIANAQLWIEEQISSKKEDSQSEFDRRLKESRSMLKGRESTANRGGRGGKGRARGMRSRRGKGRGSKGGKKFKKGCRDHEHSSEPSDCDHSGDDSKEEPSDHEDAKSSTSSKKGPSSRNPFQELMAGLKSRGGLRSGAARLLDSRQKNIEESLFYEDACEVEFHYTSCPPPGLISTLPNPGEVQAMSRTGWESEVSSEVDLRQQDAGCFGREEV